MNSWTEVLSVVGFFLLRLGIPIGITVGLAWGLRRLDAKWQAEAQAEGEAALSIEIPQSALQPFASEKPCWEQRHCAQEVRDDCPAYQHQTLPCWLSRREVEGAIPASCFGCGIFQATGGVVPSPARVVAH